MAIFPGAISTDADLYIAVNNLSTLLTDNPLTIGATTVNVISTTGFPTVGFISIGAEIIKYTGKTATSFTGCTRGADGTSAAAHALNDQVDHFVIAAHHNANKDEIIAIEQNLSDRIGLGSTQLKAINGSAASPSYSFASDLNTGMTLSGVDEISFAAGGAYSLRIETSFVRTFKHIIPDVTNTNTLGNITSAFSRLFVNAGTAGAPSSTFGGDDDTGVFSPGANRLGFATGGAEHWEVTSAGDLSVFGTTERLIIADGSVAIPAINFAGDPDTGLYRNTNNQFRLVAGANIVATASFDGTTAQFICGSGSVSAPAICIAGNPAQGFYRVSGIDVTGTSVPIGFQNGSASNPSIQFDGDPNTGVYRFGNDAVSIAGGGTEYLRIGVTGASGAIHSPAVGGFSNTINSPGNVAIFYAENSDNTNGSSHAQFQATVAGSGSGDAKVGFLVTAITGYSCGIDNSDSDNWKVSASSTLGSNDVIVVTTSTLGVSIRGTNTNDSAAAGFVGQYMESTSNGAAANTAANDTWFDMTSLSLTAGEWEVYLMAHGSRNTATWTRFDAGIGTTTGNSAAGLVIARNYAINEFASSATTPNNVTVMVASYRVQLTATTTYYAKARANFSSGQPQYVYTMFARRVR